MKSVWELGLCVTEYYQYWDAATVYSRGDKVFFHGEVVVIGNQGVGQEPKPGADENGRPLTIEQLKAA